MPSPFSISVYDDSILQAYIIYIVRHNSIYLHICSTFTQQFRFWASWAYLATVVPRKQIIVFDVLEAEK